MRTLSNLKSDAAAALRQLRKAPGFAFVCVLTLALGIGGNTAVFTLIDGVMLKPLPVQRPGELYRLGDTDACCVNSGLQGSFSLFSYDLYTHLRDAGGPFTQVAAFQANIRGITIGRADQAAPPETLNGSFVSGNYFQLFELVPAAGRLLQPSDDRPGAAPAAVISYRAWIDRFQARADVVGSTMTLNGVAATIVGVAPQDFYGDTLRPSTTGIWVPLATEPVLQPASRLLEAKGSHWLYAIGRLPPGTPTAPVQARLTAALQHWLVTTLDLSAEERGQVARQHVTLIGAAGGVSNMRDRVAPTLELLQAIALGVLLVACANLANLLLVRGMGRKTETAVRVALGAPRGRLVTLFLVESVMLAGAGGLAGLVVAFAAARAIIAVAFPNASDMPVQASPSLLVLGFAMAVSLLTGMVFGAAPAIVGSRSQPLDAMRGAGRTTGERGSRLRRGLITLQVALSLVLMACAGLLGRSLQQLESQDFGFRTDSRFVAYLAPSLSTIPAEELASVYARTQGALLQVPGVRNAAFSLYSPMSGDNWSGLITVDGHDPAEHLSASWNRVSPRYFDTIGTPLVRGRAFDERDGAGPPPVAIVSESFARTFFGDRNPIGRRIGFTDSRRTGARDTEIVGIVGDAKYQDARKAAYPTFYLPFLQPASPSGMLRAGW